MRGIAWAETHELDKAIDDFDECLRLKPNTAVYLYWRGAAWVAKKDFAKAIQDLDEAIRLDPQNAYSFNRRGLAWLGKNDQDRAVRLRRGHPPQSQQSAVLLHAQGLWNTVHEWDRAISDLDKGIRIDAKDAFAFLSRGRAWEAKKDYDKAVSRLR